MTKTEKLLTAITKAATFETKDRGRDLLIAMRELLSVLKNGSFDSNGYLVDPDEIESSFLTLFRLWLGETGYKVPARINEDKVPPVEAKTLDDAFTAIYAVSATHGVSA
jgi:hypothetical protein